MSSSLCIAALHLIIVIVPLAFPFHLFPVRDYRHPWLTARLLKTIVIDKQYCSL
jgi:hypothetical protein